MAAKPAPKLAAKADATITNAELAAYVAEVVKQSDDRLIETIRAIVREELKASDAAHADAISCQTVMLTTEISTAIANTASLSGQRPGRAKSAPKNSGVPTNDLSMFRALMEEKGDFYNTIIGAPALQEEKYASLVAEGKTSGLVIPAWNMLNSKDGLTVIVDDEETVWKTDVVTKLRTDRLQAAAAGATEDAPAAEAEAAEADGEAAATEADGEAAEEEAVAPKPKKVAVKRAAKPAATKPVAAKAAKPAAPKAAAAPKAPRAKK